MLPNHAVAFLPMPPCSDCLASCDSPRGNCYPNEITRQGIQPWGNWNAITEILNIKSTDRKKLRNSNSDEYKQDLLNTTHSYFENTIYDYGE
jgi:hypothetical protein